MPRRQSIPRKAKYETSQKRVTDHFRAKLMRDGKQTLSDRILRQALARAEFQAKRPGLEVLEAALRNATPIIEVKPRRVGGATYQVPVEIRGDRRMSLGVRWLVQAARKRNGSCHGWFAPSGRDDYHLKWLKARFASAILWVSSRRFTAAPRPFMASTNSAASFSLMLLPLRLRADWTSQRTPSDIRRSPRISTGTW